MATKSFDEDMVLDTQEAVDNFIRAFDLAERRGPLDLSKTKGISSNPKMMENLMRDIS